MSDWKANFSGLVLRAVAGVGEWRPVLEASMAATNAIVGVISLREFKTANPYASTEADRTLEAPLIVGMDPVSIAIYFERFQAIDPWAAVERQHHPQAPYFMSDHISLPALQQTDFFREWLQPKRVADCVVAEVHRSVRHWVALNLLFDASVAARRAQILDQVIT